MLIRNDYKPRMTPAQTKKLRPEVGDKRIYLVLLGLACLFVALVGRVAYFQTIERGVWENRVQNVFVRTVTEPGMRGKILDRNGALLAISEPMGDVIIDTYKLPDFADLREKNRHKPKMLQKIAEQEQLFRQNVAQVAQLLGLSQQKAKSLFDYHSYDGKKRGDIYLVRNADKSLLDQLRGLNLDGLKITQAAQRRYPDGQLFGQIIGVTKTDVTADNKTEKTVGLEGLEYAFNKSLQSQDGSRVMVQDNHGNFIDAVDSPNNREPANGRDLVLSLDKNIQTLTMSALQQAVSLHSAESASAVVLDAHTGEVLAMANYPSFDPSQFTRYPTAARRNAAALDVIEPGSALKPFIVAKAMDLGKVAPGTFINTAAYELGGRTIRDVHDYPSLSVTGVIQKSSNVGSSKLARMVPASELHTYLTDLGFASKPNSGFPGEAEGVLHPWQSWRPIDQAVIGYGYNMQVSLLQLARAYTVFTNDGALLPVTILKQDKQPQGVSLLQAKTAQQMRRMMMTVTETGGTGTRGAIDGYDVAAKSGTAQKLINGRYSNNAHRALFVGFAPVENPRAIVVVSVDNPRKNGYYGGVVAAPAFAEIMGGTLNQLGVPPTKRPPIQTLASNSE